MRKVKFTLTETTLSLNAQSGAKNKAKSIKSKNNFIEVHLNIMLCNMTSEKRIRT